MVANPIQQTAVHESGHAIAAMRLGVPFDAVELRIDAADGLWFCSGRLRGAELPEVADNQRLWAQLIVIMAGYASQSLLAPSAGFSLIEFRFPDDRDYAAAISILESMQPAVMALDDCRAAMTRAWHEARNLIVDNWPRMTAIADELVRRSQPNGETVACRIALTEKDLARFTAEP